MTRIINRKHNKLLGLLNRENNNQCTRQHAENGSQASGSIATPNGKENDVWMLYTSHTRLTKKNVSEQWTVHSTPFQIHEESRVPMTKHSMCSRTCIEFPTGLQMAMPMIQMQSSDERGTPMSKGSRQRCSDKVYTKCSITNNKSTRWAEAPSTVDSR
jgi:hypothetical protein